MTLSPALLDVAEKIVVMVVDAFMCKLVMVVRTMEPIPQTCTYRRTGLLALTCCQGDLLETILTDAVLREMSHGLIPDMVMNMRLCQNAITPGYLTWS